jgi:hypothetical protein
MRHVPVLVSRKLMNRMEEEWKAEFAFSASAEGDTQKPSRRLQLQTLYSQYALDVGAAVQVDSPGVEIHTNSENKISPSTVSRILCASLAGQYAWAQIQGPGWSDEYTRDLEFEPRADLHRLISSFFHLILPSPCEAEDGGRAASPPPFQSFC